MDGVLYVAYKTPFKKVECHFKIFNPLQYDEFTSNTLK